MGNVELHKRVLEFFDAAFNTEVMRDAAKHGVSYEECLTQHTDLERLDVKFKEIVGERGALVDLGIHYFVGLGVEAIRLYCHRGGLSGFEDKAIELHDIYKRKNSDYGNSFENSLDIFGVIASVVRLQDKVSRYVSLTTGGNSQQVLDEKVDDTLLDLINYCVMTVMYFETKYSKVVILGEKLPENVLLLRLMNYSILELPSDKIVGWFEKRCRKVNDFLVEAEGATYTVFSPMNR